MKVATDVFQDCKYLFLHSIGEPDEGGLRLIVHEARVGGPPSAEELAAEAFPALRTILAGSKAIEHGPGCKVFEITWEQYIAYAVDNESYALPEPKESIGTGRLFIEYTKSVYLDYLSKVSFASADYPGPFKHWALLCLDHIVNVVSTNEPKIKITHAV
jgi:hypothetical protein